MWSLLSVFQRLTHFFKVLEPKLCFYDFFPFCFHVAFDRVVQFFSATSCSPFWNKNRYVRFWGCFAGHFSERGFKLGSQGMEIEFTIVSFHVLERWEIRDILFLFFGQRNSQKSGNSIQLGWKVRDQILVQYKDAVNFVVIGQPALEKVPPQNRVLAFWSRYPVIENIQTSQERHKATAFGVKAFSFEFHST